LYPYKDIDSDDGDDFMPNAAKEPEDDFDEDILENSQESDEDNQYGNGPSTQQINVFELDPAPTQPPRKTAKLKRGDITAFGKGKSPIVFTVGGGTRPRAFGAIQLRTRGVADFTKSGGQHARLRFLFGPRNQDLEPILLTRDHWIHQDTMPLKAAAGLRRSFFEAAGAREKESQITQTWFVDAGSEAFMKGQKSKDLTAAEARAYMANTGSDELNVLSGPFDDPEVCAVEKLSCLSMGQSFGEEGAKRGWLLNLGSRIQDAQWAPAEGNCTQHLAVIVEQKPTTGRQSKPMENPKAPAFSTTKPFPASIQIWVFEGNENGGMDDARQPRLQVVICTDWGAPKQVRWSPVETFNTSSEDLAGDIYVGLLAGLWSDGRVRVLRVSYPRSGMEATQPHYVHVARAAFDVGFPQTVPSVIHWLSDTTLAVATAAGTLAIWTLSRSDIFTSSPTQPYGPRPWFYQSIAETYILTLSSGRPSQPHLICITTADGITRLYDIRTPNADTTTSIRGRNLSLTQDWHEHTQSFVMSDEYYLIKHNPIRRFYHNFNSVRTASIITRCATSPVQPGMLVGGADGRVEVTNPVARIINYKVIPFQQTWFTHEWRGPVEELELEVPVTETSGEDVEMNECGSVQEIDDLFDMTDGAATAGETTNGNGDKTIEGTADADNMIEGDVTGVKLANDQHMDGDATQGTAAGDGINDGRTTGENLASPDTYANEVPHLVLSQPLVRITEEYVVYQPGIAHSTTVNNAPNPELKKGISIYEEKSAITALSWNPNLRFGTWAVAGMGSGLLRVEDIGI
jgi:transcription factor C subunit 6